jgi:hypothetical protein
VPTHCSTKLAAFKTTLYNPNLSANLSAVISSIKAAELSTYNAAVKATNKYTV